MQLLLLELVLMSAKVGTTQALALHIVGLAQPGGHLGHFERPTILAIDPVHKYLQVAKLIPFC